MSLFVNNWFCEDS